MVEYQIAWKIVGLVLLTGLLPVEQPPTANEAIQRIAHFTDYRGCQKNAGLPRSYSGTAVAVRL